MRRWLGKRFSTGRRVFAAAMLGVLVAPWLLFGAIFVPRLLPQSFASGLFVVFLLVYMAPPMMVAEALRVHGYLSDSPPYYGTALLIAGYWMLLAAIVGLMSAAVFVLIRRFRERRTASSEA